MVDILCVGRCRSDAVNAAKDAGYYDMLKYKVIYVGRESDIKGRRDGIAVVSPIAYEKSINESIIKELEWNGFTIIYK